MTSPATNRVLVVGCGSIGRRHIRNLRSLKVKNITAFDPEPQRLAQTVADYEVETAGSLEQGLAQHPQAVLICTPPHLHLSVAAQAAEAGAHLLVEKPVADKTEGVSELLDNATRRGLVFMVGYNLRFHPALQRMKCLMDEGEIGRIMTVRAEFGQYLPDWRPAQDYRQGYIVKEATGGGILLDGSHELDYTCWLGGAPESVFCVAEKLSDLDMETEDTAFLTVRHQDGVVSQVQLDCTQRGYARCCKVTGTRGTLVWDFREGVRLTGESGEEVYSMPGAASLDQTYIDEMKCFLSCVNGEGVPPVDGEAGLRVLKVVQAARESARLRREVRL